MGSRTKKDNRSQSKQAINSCSSRRPFAPCASWGSWLLAVGVLASPRLMCIFVIICLLLWPKGTITPREKPAALATRAHDSSSNHTDDYFKQKTKITCGTEGFSRQFRLALCETLRAPSHVQGRRNAREAANPPRRENQSKLPRTKVPSFEESVW